MLTGNVNAQLVVQMYRTEKKENIIKYKRMTQRYMKVCSDEQPGHYDVFEAEGGGVARLGETTKSLCADDNHASVRLCIILRRCERRKEI